MKRSLSTALLSGLLGLSALGLSAVAGYLVGSRGTSGQQPAAAPTGKAMTVRPAEEAPSQDVPPPRAGVVLEDLPVDPVEEPPPPVPLPDLLDPPVVPESRPSPPPVVDPPVPPDQP